MKSTFKTDPIKFVQLVAFIRLFYRKEQILIYLIEVPRSASADLRNFFQLALEKTVVLLGKLRQVRQTLISRKTAGL